MSDLATRRCQACEGGIPVASAETVKNYMQELPGWELTADGKSIIRTYHFNNFYETMAFVNALAFIAHQEDHHPDQSVHYAKCVVTYSTHAVQGLTDNDFICAAKVNGLILTMA